MALNVARRHAQRVHRQNLFIEARETCLMLLDQLRLKGAVAIARHLDFHLAGIALQLLPALPIARVAAVVPGYFVLLVGEPNGNQEGTDR